MAHFFRALQRKFGIAAPRMAVRARIPWYWHGLAYVAAGAMVLGVGWTTYHYGMELAGFHRSEAASAVANLDEQIRQRDSQIAKLRSRVAAAERQLQIERATYADLAGQVKALGGENAALREDLAFYQSLMAAGGGGKEGAISINRFRVQPEALPGEYRYRLLLVQTGKRVKEFHGKLQFVLNLEQDDRKFALTLPGEGEKTPKEYQVSFKFFQRVEGTFKVTPGAVVKSLQVRVFENGSVTPKLLHTASIS
jgi:TolA-binding protein